MKIKLTEKYNRKKNRPPGAIRSDQKGHTINKSDIHEDIKEIELEVKSCTQETTRTTSK